MNQHMPVKAGQAFRHCGVGITSIATAVPPFRFSQEDAMARAAATVPAFAHMTGVFANSGIEARYSSVPLEWYETPRGWRESNAVYVENSLDLLQRVAMEALARAGRSAIDVGAVVLVTSSGLAIPSLEARLASRIGLSPAVQRTPVFGLGCAGGTTGLARAAQLARAMPGQDVLLLVVELGGLNVHVNQESAALFVSTALFGDGAAAVLLNAPSSSAAAGRGFVGATGEHLWPDTTWVMGWEVMDDGLDVVLSGRLPGFTRDELRPPLEAFLATAELTLADIEGYVVHPGGPKVMEAIEQALGLPADALRHSRSVLRDFGNMSAPTVLFVLERTIAAGARGRHLMMSFGPGFTATFAIVDL